MRKNMKTLGALACAGVLGLGAIGNTAMAAPGQGDTNVYYTSNATNIDADGKVVMLIPADVNLNKNTMQREMKLTLKTSDGSEFVNNFSATVNVKSKNLGKLQEVNGTKQAGYYLNDENSTNIDLTKESKAADFAQTPDQPINEQTKILTAGVTNDNVTVLEESASGTRFSDVLTFKVSALTGYNPL